MVHQRQGTVFEFAGRVGLGVDVGDLLEFERPFHRDRKMTAATQEQGVVFLDELFGQALDAVVELQRPVQHFGGARQFPHPAFETVGIHAAGQGGQLEHQELQRRQLGGERLGRCHADFKTGPGHQHQARLAHDRTLRHVADHQCGQVPRVLRVPQGSQRVRRLARL